MRRRAFVAVIPATALVLGVVAWPAPLASIGSDIAGPASTTALAPLPPGQATLPLAAAPRSDAAPAPTPAPTPTLPAPTATAATPTTVAGQDATAVASIATPIYEGIEGPLRMAGFDVSGPVTEDVLVAVTDALGVDVGARIDAGDVATILDVAQRRVDGALRGLGLDPGSRVDETDLRAAAKTLRFAVGSSVDPSDVRHIVSLAEARAIRAISLAGVNLGTTVDDDDWRRAARALGLAPGRTIDASDVRAITRAAERRLRARGSTTVSKGLRYERFQLRQRGGPVVLHRLSWRLGDPRLEVRAEPAGRFGGRASVLDAYRARGPRRVRAVVNGGFWLGSGDPDGLLVSGGRLVSEPGTGRSWVRGDRGAFGWSADRHVVGRPAWEGTLHAEATGGLRIRAVDRPIRGDELVVTTRSTGPRTGTPSGTVEVTVAATRLPTDGSTTGKVVAVSRSGNERIPAGGLVLSGRGAHGRKLDRLRPGDEVTLTVNIPGWGQVDQAMAGGPLLLQDGRPTPRAEWNAEGFGPRHNQRRHPRTAIGFDGRGGAFVLVIDGRQPGYSIGATTEETIAIMRAFGAVDAVMLDGGGSSQLAFKGRNVNRDCCDRRHRAVATVLAFYRP